MAEPEPPPSPEAAAAAAQSVKKGRPTKVELAAREAAAAESLRQALENGRRLVQHYAGRV